MFQRNFFARNALALMALTSAFSLAADKPKFYDEVLSVEGNTITLYRSPTKEAKFKITSATKIIVDYKQGSIGDLKVGMKATVTHKADSDEATAINARTMKSGY
jgi:hypothetical protein